MVAAQQRLTRRADFHRVTRSGRSWAGKLLILKIAPSDLEWSRCGFSVSKAIGTAVARNLVKRRLRAIVRERRLIPGWDIVFIAREPTKQATYEDTRVAAVQLLTRARLLIEEHEETGT